MLTILRFYDFKNGHKIWSRHPPFRSWGAKYHPAGSQDEAAEPSKCRLSVGPRSRPWAAKEKKGKE